uniref:Cadherin domain-containing protein n=1 Tax=Biomphalaria glabrata TaxID=6526 RepID=A0A2C9KEI4_BIOGL
MNQFVPYKAVDREKWGDSVTRADPAPLRRANPAPPLRRADPAPLRRADPAPLLRKSRENDDDEISISNCATSTVTIDARVTDMYDTISTSTYTDPENDALTFSMTSNPSDNYFSIGAGDGIIRAAIDMHTATTLAHKLTVSATDSYNTVSPAYVLYVEITNINTAPSIDGLPAKVFLPESAKAGDTIVVLSITDDGNLPLSPVCSATSTADNVKFTYDSNSDALVVKYDGAFDYETQSSYSITCTVSDGYLSSSGNDVLTLIITNVNEMPVFNKNQYFCVLDEGSLFFGLCDLRREL